MAINPLLLATTLLIWAMCPGRGEAATEANFTYHTHTSAAGSTPYRLFVPAGYVATTSYPLVLFLHGSGESGTNNTSPLNGGANGALVFVSTANQASYPCFMLIPQATSSGWTAAVRREHLPAIIASLRATYSINPNRILITGLSMGGSGTWDQLAQNPTLYAAAVPICGWGLGNYTAFAGVPIWAFHAANDPGVDVSGSRNAIAAVRAAGGDPIYTEYATGGHPSWVPAYQNPHLVPWMMAQRRGTPRVGNPRIDITAPTSATSYITSAATLRLAGSGWSTAAITGVIWSAGSGRGTATGTTDWSASGVPLTIGSNLVRVTATGTSWSTTLGGFTTFSDTLTVTRSAVTDSMAPTVTITSPTSAATTSTTATTLNLAGTAADNVGVNRVTWSNDRGGSGTAAGTTNWSVASLPLQTGINVITTTAHDAAGNSATDILTVTVTLPSGPGPGPGTDGGGCGSGSGSGLAILVLVVAMGLQLRGGREHSV